VPKAPGWTFRAQSPLAEGTVGLWLSVKTNAPPGATILVNRDGEPRI